MLSETCLALSKNVLSLSWSQESYIPYPAFRHPKGSSILQVIDAADKATANGIQYGQVLMHILHNYALEFKRSLYEGKYLCCDGKLIWAFWVWNSFYIISQLCFNTVELHWFLANHIGPKVFLSLSEASFDIVGKKVNKHKQFFSNMFINKSTVK